MNDLLAFALIYIVLPVMFVCLFILADQQRPDRRQTALNEFAPAKRPFASFPRPLLDLLHENRQHAGQTIDHWFEDTQQAVTFILFDYSYASGQWHYTQTAFAVDLKRNQLNLPPFLLRERQAADWVKKQLDYTFVELPPFTKPLTLMLFDGQAKPHFEALPSEIWHAQTAARGRIICNGRWFIYYHEDKRLPPTAEAYQQFTGQALNILKQFDLP